MGKGSDPIGARLLRSIELYGREVTPPVPELVAEPEPAVRAESV